MRQIETHNIEYKSSWRDEYLGWICGFANADGGSLFIGVNDKGVPIDGENIKKLSEDLPNKIRDILGIIVDVLILNQNGVDYLEIKVHPYNNAISCQGRFYYRSGSTKQELKGTELTHFLLKKSGKTWDGLTESTFSIEDLSSMAFDFYREKAIEKGRMEKKEKSLSDKMMLEKLHLTENGMLTKAAILMFHPNPDDVIPGAFIKIGAFREDGTLIYHDEIHGSLPEQIERAYNLIETKYTSFAINYDGAQRKEVSPFSLKSVRECISNSVAHKQYSEAIPIQIKVFTNKIIFWNPGRLPDKWTSQDLRKTHISKPFNEKVAHALFKCGYIEAWGQGTLDIISDSIAQNGIPPIFSTRLTGMMVTLFRSDDEFYKVSDFDEKQMTILKAVQNTGRITNKEVQSLLGVSKATSTRILQQLTEEILVLHGIGAGAYYSFR